MSDELDPLLEEEGDLIIPKKKGGSSDEDDDLFGDGVPLEDEDPFISDLGYVFGGEDEDGY